MSTIRDELRIDRSRSVDESLVKIEEVERIGNPDTSFTSPLQAHLARLEGDHISKTDYLPSSEKGQ